jgi:hypothetical protein
MCTVIVLLLLKTLIFKNKNRLLLANLCKLNKNVDKMYHKIIIKLKIKLKFGPILLWFCSVVIVGLVRFGSVDHCN